jgi:methyltransferase of ATP-grasp peptide maturase system
VTTVEPADQRLVDTLVAAGHLHSQPWIDAFRTVPRHMFVPRIFNRTSTGSYEAVGQDDPLWADLVYADIPLTTQLDGDGSLWDKALRNPVTGVPTSSSSQPSLMAQMLEALDVRDGHQVLEVGTGTGYNAALLAHRLGSSMVVTVEVDPVVAEAARGSLHAACYTPTVSVADGSAGYAEDAPYDRIIATYSVPSVPTAWIEQTRPGGLVETSLYRPLGGAPLVRLTVAADGGAQGRFLPGGGSFMPTRDQPVREALPLLKAALRSEPDGHARPSRVAADLLPHPDFGLIAALLLVDVTTIELQPDGHRNQTWLLADPDTWAYLDNGTGLVTQRGSRRLWDELEELHHGWESAGQPTRERYGLTVRSDGRQQVWLDHPDKPVSSPAVPS